MATPEQSNHRVNAHQEIRERIDRTYQAASTLSGAVCATEESGEIYGRPVVVSRIPPDPHARLSIGMTHDYTAQYRKEPSDPALQSVSVSWRSGDMSPSSLKAISLTTSTPDGSINRIISPNGDVTMSGIAGTITSDTSTGIPLIDSLIGLRSGRENGYRASMGPHIGPDSTLYRFHSGAVATLDMRSSKLLEPEKMLVLFGLEGDEPDGLKFGERFAKGAADVVHDDLIAEGGNRTKMLCFTPALRAVDAIFAQLHNPNITPAQLLQCSKFLTALTVSAHRQLVREGPEKFCDMGADFYARMHREQPALLASVFPTDMRDFPAPHDSQRVFTKRADRSLPRPAATVGDLINADDI